MNLSDKDLLEHAVGIYENRVRNFNKMLAESGDSKYDPDEESIQTVIGSIFAQLKSGELLIKNHGFGYSVVKNIH